MRARSAHTSRAWPPPWPPHGRRLTESLARLTGFGLERFLQVPPTNRTPSQLLTWALAEDPELVDGTSHKSEDHATAAANETATTSWGGATCRACAAVFAQGYTL